MTHATHTRAAKRFYVQAGHLRRRVGRIWIPDGLHIWWKNRGVHIFWSARPHVEFDRTNEGSDREC